MPVTAEMAEKWGLANHIVEDSQVLSKAIEVAEAIARNNRNLVVLYKSVINDGLQLDMKHARALEKVRIYEVRDTITYPWLNLQPIFVVLILYGAQIMKLWGDLVNVSNSVLMKNQAELDWFGTLEIWQNIHKTALQS